MIEILVLLLVQLISPLLGGK